MLPMYQQMVPYLHERKKRRLFFQNFELEVKAKYVRQLMNVFAVGDLYFSELFF